MVVKLPGRGAQAGCSVVSPDDAGERLIRGALRRRNYPVAAQAFHFVVGGRVFRAVHGRGRRNPKLTGRLQDEGNALAPVPAQREWDEADGILPPIARQVARNKIHAHERFGELRTVIRFEGEDCGGGPLA